MTVEVDETQELRDKVLNYEMEVRHLRNSLTAVREQLDPGSEKPDLDLYDLWKSVDDALDKPCLMCRMNRSEIRYDHTTYDHAEYSTAP